MAASTASDLRVLAVTNIAAPYRVELFNRVHSRFRRFSVAYQSTHERGRNWEGRPAQPYPVTYLRGISVSLGPRRTRLSFGLKGLLRAEDPDVVVVGGFSPTAARVTRICTRDRRRIILMNDGTSVTDPVRGPEAWYRRRLVSLASGFIGASASSREYFARLGAEWDRVTVVQLTTDLRAIRDYVSQCGARDRARARWGLGHRVLCFVGQLVARKRPLEALRAYFRASELVDDLSLVIAGDGPLRPLLEREIRRQGGERVRLLGSIPWSDVLDVYAASDLHLFPVVAEPYGMVVIESLAAGVPVVSTPESAAALDLIDEGRSGFLVEPGDVTAMVERIQQFFEVPESMERARGHAQQVVDKYDVTRAADHFVQAVEAAVRERVRGSLRQEWRGGGEEHSRERVVYLTKELPRYRVPFVRELQRRGVDLHVIVVGGRTPSLLGGFDGLNGKVASVYSVRGLGRRKEVVTLCHSLRPGTIIVEHGARLGFAWSALFSRKLRYAKRVLWTHGIENRELHGGRRDLGSLGRWMQIAGADAILCYDREMSVRLGRRYPRKRVGAAPNSTDGRPLAGARDELVREGKGIIKRRIGLSRASYLVALGRLVRGKEFHRLPGILRRVRHSLPDVGLIIIGDGPQRVRIRRAIAKAGLTEGVDVVLPGTLVEPQSLAAWLYCSDVCVNPGYVGLNVVDTLFAGLPSVVAYPGSAGPYHSPEWRYLRDCAGGLFVDRNDDATFAAKVVEYLTLPAEGRTNVEAACRDFARSHLGIEQMADGLLELLGRLHG